MACRRRPRDFAYDAEATGGWLIAGETWTHNPLLVVPRSIFAAVDLWLMARAHGGAMGARLLPCAGAIADQPAALLDAFALLDGIADEEEA